MESIMDEKEIIERITELEEDLETCPHCREGLLLEESLKTNKCPDCEQSLIGKFEITELNILYKMVKHTEEYGGHYNYGKLIIHENITKGL